MLMMNTNANDADAKPMNPSMMRLITGMEASRATTSRVAPYKCRYPLFSLFFVSILLMLCFVSLCDAYDGRGTTNTTEVDPPDFLSNDSVVLITGAAGFIGSELAMALHRVYSPKKIICVDNMENMAFSARRADHTEDVRFNRDELEEQYLSLFESKRKRAFHVMQTLGSKVHFYRADFRPSIPEYFDVGEVPVLHNIFRNHPDISHIVHLADPYHRSAPTEHIQAVPRVKGDIKSGMMEALMEQLKKLALDDRPVPHFTYASSYEIYNFITQDNPHGGVFKEEYPITAPSTLRGTSKLLDEIMARGYYHDTGIYSIALRFFPVYGPGGLQGTPLYEMAERAVSQTERYVLDSSVIDNGSIDDVRDFIYLDDAVDAIMAAMQFRTSNGVPTFVNVGTGRGTSYRDVAEIMEKLVPRVGTSSADSPDKWEKPSYITKAVASIDRAGKILGFKPQVSLEEGLDRLLSWHYDRTSPYGGRRPESKISLTKGITSCSSFDKECLHGAPVFPCASECSHHTQCTTSYFDEVLEFTRAVTEDCETVLYTTSLGSDVSSIPSAAIYNATSSSSNSSFLKGDCNVAFVSEFSSIVSEAKTIQQIPLSTMSVEEFMRLSGSIKSNTKNEKTRKTSESGKLELKLLKHGFWTLIPLTIPSFGDVDEFALELLPKLSPGLFFGKKTQRAIYCAPNVIFKNIPSLLEEAKMQPYLKGVDGATGLLIGRDQGDNSEAPSSGNESTQGAAYRMIRIGIIDQMASVNPLLEPSWMVHRLQNEDTRVFRCDVYGEVVQWDVAHDKSAFEFIIGLHDLWSRVIGKGKGKEPWWVGDKVVTVHEDEDRRRRLGEEVAEQEEEDTSQKDAQDEDAHDEDAQDEDNQDEDAQDEVVQDEDAQKEDAQDEEQQQEEENTAKKVTDTGNEKEEDNSASTKDSTVHDGSDEQISDKEEQGDKDGGDNDNAKAAPSGENHKDVDKEGKTGVDEEKKEDEGGDDSVEVRAKSDIADAEPKSDGKAFKVDILNALSKSDTEQVEEKEDAFGVTQDEVGEEKKMEQQEDEEEEEDMNVARDIAPSEGKKTLDEDTASDEGEGETVGKDTGGKKKSDISSYDTWMGILSTDKQHFVRIVPSDEVGAVFLDAEEEADE